MIPRKLKPCAKCGDPCYLFSGGMCRNCWGMTKIREQQEQVKKGINPAKPFKAIKKVSDKQSKLNRIYEVAAMQFKKDKPLCMAKLPGCTGGTAHVHHLFSGASRSKYFLDQTTWITCCNNCHHLIHDVMGKDELINLGLKRIE